jgi:hypothetical protein
LPPAPTLSCETLEPKSPGSRVAITSGFQHNAPYTPPLKATKVRDAEGRIEGAREYEPRLTIEGMRATAIAKAWANRYW